MFDVLSVYYEYVRVYVIFQQYINYNSILIILNTMTDNYVETWLHMTPWRWSIYLAETCWSSNYK